MTGTLVTATNEVTAGLGGSVKSVGGRTVLGILGTHGLLSAAMLSSGKRLC